MIFCQDGSPASLIRSRIRDEAMMIERWHMRNKRIEIAIIGSFLLFIGLYLLRLHYVQDYSDPVGFLRRAQLWATVGDHADRAPLYPIILYGFMQILGRNWVFLANLPFVLLLIVMLGACTRSLFKYEEIREDGLVAVACLLPGAIFFAVRSELLLQMVNPYREPIALFVLLLVAFLFVKGWRSCSLLIAATSGLLLGGITSMRETSLLLILPLGLWALRQMWADRRLRFGFLLVFGVGVLIGLLPLLMKNYQFGGSALVPAYSAGRVTHYTETGSWDIPIPGMSIDYFQTTGPNAVRRIVRHYRWYGSLFFVIGLATAFKRRNRDITYLYFPAFWVFFLFHCFYNRVLGRYFLTAEIFGVPIIAYGMLTAWCWFETRVSGSLRDRLPLLRKAMGLFLAFLLLYPLLPPLIRGNARTKVWHLETIRAELSETIEKPAIFMGGRHFAYRLSWLLDQSFYEYTHRFLHDRRIHASLENRLREHGHYTVYLFSEGNFYIDESNFAVASNWLQRDPVFDFSDLSVPFDRYGRLLSGHLYRVRLWQQNRVELVAEEQRSEDAILMLDLRRPWDYQERSFLHGREASLPDVQYDLTNGVQFVELPTRRADQPFQFVMESDQPLAPDPVWSLHSKNDDIQLTFGMGADAWAWNWVSGNMFPNPFIPLDSAQLYDQGYLYAPIFADQDHEVFAEVGLAFMQDHPYWLQGPGHTLAATVDERIHAWRLPPRHQVKRIVIPLGRGANSLQRSRIDLRTTLPGWETQISDEFRRMCNHHGFVKLSDMRVLSFLPPAEWPVVIPVGDAGDAAHIQSGFFNRERSAIHTGRWTMDTAELRVWLPNVEASTPLTVIWDMLPIRPDHHEVVPLFTVDGVQILPGNVAVDQREGVWRYQFQFPDELSSRGGQHTLSVHVPSWSPSRMMGSRDLRDLGVFVAGLEVRP